MTRTPQLTLVRHSDFPGLGERQEEVPASSYSQLDESSQVAQQLN